jgi:hypothetical protein
MSEFSNAFGLAWDASVAVFGDTILFGVSATAYSCVIQDLSLSTEVENGRPGRVAVLAGLVAVSAATWAAVSGRKGLLCTVGGAEARVLNDPDIGATSDTVILVLGPRT